MLQIFEKFVFFYNLAKKNSRTNKKSNFKKKDVKKKIFTSFLNSKRTPKGEFKKIKKNKIKIALSKKFITKSCSFFDDFHSLMRKTNKKKNLKKIL